METQQFTLGQGGIEAQQMQVGTVRLWNRNSTISPCNSEIFGMETQQIQVGTVRLWDGNSIIPLWDREIVE